jgi:hypothetical protein
MLIVNSVSQAQINKQQQQAVRPVWLAVSQAALSSSSYALFSFSFPNSPFLSTPHLFLTDVPPGRLFLLPLLRGEIHRLRRLIHKTATPKTNHRPPKVDSRTQ